MTSPLTTNYSVTWASGSYTITYAGNAFAAQTFASATKVFVNHSNANYFYFGNDTSDMTLLDYTLCTAPAAASRSALITAITALDISASVITVPVAVANGGTGTNTLTSGALVTGNGAGAVTATTMPLSVANGGTGTNTLTSGALVTGNGAGAVTSTALPLTVPNGGTGVATLTSGQILVGNGAGVVTTTASTSVGTRKLISTQTIFANTSTVNFATDATTVGNANTIEFVIEGLTVTGNASTLVMRCSIDGTNFIATNYQGGFQTTAYNTTVSANTNAVVYWPIVGQFNTFGTDAASATIKITGLNATLLQMYATGNLYSSAVTYSFNASGTATVANVGRAAMQFIVSPVQISGVKISLYAII